MIKSAVCDLLDIKYPLFQGGMAWIADGRLAASVSEAGGLGIIAAGNQRAEDIRKQINIANAGQWVATAPRRVRAKMMKEDPTLVEDWDEKVGDRMVKLVFIGQKMDKEEICAELDKCLAE